MCFTMFHSFFPGKYINWRRFFVNLVVKNLPVFARHFDSAEVYRSETKHNEARGVFWLHGAFFHLTGQWHSTGICEKKNPKVFMFENGQFWKIRRINCKAMCGYVYIICTCMYCTYIYIYIYILKGYRLCRQPHNSDRRWLKWDERQISRPPEFFGGHLYHCVSSWFCSRSPSCKAAPWKWPLRPKGAL